MRFCSSLRANSNSRQHCYAAGDIFYCTKNPINVLVYLVFFMSSQNLKVSSARGLQNSSLCNKDEHFECVCTEQAEDPITRWCDSFVEEILHILCMTTKNVDLQSRLYTNETFQQYIRRRIANILTHYCDKHPTECAGTIAESRYLARSEPEAENLLELIHFDTGEPVFNRESIVFLRINSSRGETEMCFAAMKRNHYAGPLDSSSTMDPAKMKQIFLKQVAPLSRILGGLEIVQLRIGKIRRKIHYSQVDNGRLVVVVVIGVGFMIICWTIWIFWQLRKCGHWDRFKGNFGERRKASNYGTCTEKLYGNNNKLNNNQGNVSNGYTNTMLASSTTANKSCLRNKSLTEHEIKLPNDIDVGVEKHGMYKEDSVRMCQNIFVCDHSQLPKEEPDELLDEYHQNIIFEPCEHETMAKNERHGKRSSADNLKVNTMSALQTKKHMKSNERSTNVERLNPSRTEIQIKTGDLLLTLEDIDRPLSRRGSYDDRQEQDGGGEETFGSREDTPQPLGDEGEIPCIIPLINIDEMDVAHFSKNRKKWPALAENNDDSDVSEDDFGNVQQQYEILRESPVPSSTFNIS